MTLYLTAKKLQTNIELDMRWRNLTKPWLWSSSKNICLTHSKQNIQQKRILGLHGSLLRSILITKRWFTLSEARHDWQNLYFRTLSSWMSTILKFVGSDLSLSSVRKIWQRLIFWRRFSQLFMPPICSYNKQYRERKSTKFYELVTTL